MKIVNLKQFLELPENTLYSKFRDYAFDKLEIKGETTMLSYTFQDISGAVECDDTEGYIGAIDESIEQRKSISLDFNCEELEPDIQNNQLYAIWESTDIEQLIKRLKMCLPN